VIYAKAKQAPVVKPENAQPEAITTHGESKELTFAQRDKRALCILAGFLAAFLVIAINLQHSSPISPPPKTVEDRKPVPRQPLPQLQELDWTLGGFKNVLLASFTLRNGSASTWKDMVVQCNGFAKSGTQISSGYATVYYIITPGAMLKVKDLNLGFTDQQIYSATCHVIKAVEGL
jgi:hypothetical protein